MNYKLSPSDFAFLYEGCKRCFYHKVVNKITQPSIQLPAVFSKIAGLLKNHYDQKHTNELHKNLSSGIVALGEKWVESDIIQPPNRKSSCFIKGRFDIVIEFDDKTYGVVDFKTGSPKEEYTELYGRQLHAYAYALEHPAPGALKLYPVTMLGLLYFYPERTKQDSIEKLSYEADIHFVEIKKDENKFLKFIDEVLGLLEKDNVPKPSPKCKWCEYIETFRVRHD